jgi:hypothetical protein
MKASSIKNAFLSTAAYLLTICRKKQKPTPADLKKADYKSSTQTIGLSFTKKIRDTWRHRWIKKHTN